MAKRNSWTAVKTELARLRNDQRYEFSRPLLDFLEPLVSQPADERDKDFAIGLLTTIKKLQGERRRGADVRTQVENMAGGFIQPDWNVTGNVQQANRDFVINKIKVVFQQYASKLGELEVREAFTPKAVDLNALEAAEQHCRESIKERFAEDARYYIPLVAETTEPVTGQAATQVPHSVRRRRQQIAPEFREWVEEGREIRRVRLDNLREAVDKYPCVILLGDPGCGKTTALQHLAYELAGEKGLLPLPLRLSAFESGMKVEDFIHDGWAGPESADHWNWNSPELAAGLSAYLEAGKLLFLFDALNETPHEGYAECTRALRYFINRWSKKDKGNRFVVTCRVLDYGEELSGLKRVEIQPFSNEQIQRFLRKDLPEIWENLWQKLIEEGNVQRSLLELARNPFMLSIMTQVFSKDRHLGRNRSELMARFTEILMKELAQPKCPPEKWLDIDIQRAALAVMAFEVQHRSGFGTLVKMALAKAVMPERVKPDPKWPAVPSPPDQVLDLAASAHIIEMTGDRSSLRFYHQLLQEYYAAREMLKRDPAGLTKMWQWHWLEKDMPKWIRPKDNYDPLPPPPPTNWEETTIMAAGLMPENDHQLVQALLEVNPVLAGRCLHKGVAEVDAPFRQAVVERLLATISNPEVALRVRIAAGDVLGHLGDPRLGELVSIPAGAFMMGDDEDVDAKPQHEVVLPDYQIGKYLVSNAEFKEFVKAGSYTNKRWWTEAGWRQREEENWTEPRDWDTGQFSKPNQPVISVSLYECLAYCRWRAAETRQSYRLPTEAEWEKAARGTDGRQYPWGNEFEAGRLNSGEGEQTVRTTTPVGIYPTGKGPYGCLDMAGSVWEWTSSLWGEDWDKPEYRYPYDSTDGRENLEAGDDVLRVLRGGSWTSIETTRAALTASGAYRSAGSTAAVFESWSPPSLPPDTRHSGTLDRFEIG